MRGQVVVAPAASIIFMEYSSAPFSLLIKINKNIPNQTQILITNLLNRLLEKIQDKI